MAKTVKQARQKFELSHLESQRELLAHDVDLTQLSFITRKLPPMRFDDLATAGEITRTIEGASTVSITLDDSDGQIRNSGRLARAVDIKLDGLWFRLVKVSKAGHDITLTFESREVAILRTYNGRRVVGWGKMRRSRFMQILVEEVKEFKIPFLCPDLLKPKAEVENEGHAYERRPGFVRDEPTISPDAVEAAREARAAREAGNKGVVNSFPVLKVLPGTWAGLWVQGNINLNGRPLIKNPDGTTSTTIPITIGPEAVPPYGSGYVIIPTVVGKIIMDTAGATAEYQSTGKHLGKFATSANAAEYTKGIRTQQAEYIKKKIKIKLDGPAANPVDKTYLTLTVKGAIATQKQVDNIMQVLDIGYGLKANHRVMVSAAMTVITESRAYNVNHGMGTSVGLFQEIDSWGSVATRMHIPSAAKRYFRKAMKYDEAHPHSALWQICQGAQGSGHPRAYDEWKDEGIAFVTAFGIPGDDTSSLDGANDMILPESGGDTSKWQFTRGRPKAKTEKGVKDKWENENTWDCLRRLADQVNWRVFEVSGTIYFTTDKHLFKSAPRAKLNENSQGVETIDFDYDIGKPTSSVTVNAYIDRWKAPPGSVIEIHDMGPVNGRWLVTEITRGLFDQLGTITLKKPQARLPEPKQTDVSSLLAALTPQDPNKFVDTPGISPDTQEAAKESGRVLRELVLNNDNIHFLHSQSQRKDIAKGWIDERILRFLIYFTDAGFQADIFALKSDHTHLGSKSNHYWGRAVDLSNFTDSTPANTLKAMKWINDNNKDMNITELICHSHPELCIQKWGYSQKTLDDHDDHIHVGYDA